MNFGDYDTLDFTRKSRVLKVTMNRPHKLNTVDALMRDQSAGL